MSEPIRIFIAGDQGTELHEAPPGYEEAFDVLVADGMDGEHAAEMAYAMTQADTWRTPQQQAEHVVKLRKALR